jgi:hypothetical protein
MQLNEGSRRKFGSKNMLVLNVEILRLTPNIFNQNFFIRKVQLEAAISKGVLDNPTSTGTGINDEVNPPIIQPGVNFIKHCH